MDENSRRIISGLYFGKDVTEPKLYHTNKSAKLAD